MRTSVYRKTQVACAPDSRNMYCDIDSMNACSEL
jgi:hypothetical protein